jgi:omega-amidase
VLSDAAKDGKVYVIGGSFPVREDYKLFNTCTVWDPNGVLVASDVRYL